MTPRTYMLFVLVMMGGCGAILVSQMPPPVDQRLTANPQHDPHRTVVSSLPNISFAAAGVTHPVSVPAANALLDDSEMVIGVTIENEYRAYRLRALSAPGIAIEKIFEGGAEQQKLGRHVVNDVVNGVALAVTHCDESSCSKVYRREGTDPVDVGVGGWKDGSMMLALGATRFPQKSDVAPLPLIPFELVRWGDWRARHPGTTVYQGD